MVAVAEDEAKRISERTTAALQALIARGVKLGNPKNLNAVAAARGREMGRQKLEPHSAPQPCVGGQVDFAHPARAEWGDDAVLIDRSPRCKRSALLPGHHLRGDIEKWAGVIVGGNESGLAKRR